MQKTLKYPKKTVFLLSADLWEKRREDATHHLKEWKRGAFSRKFRLPENVTGNPEATLKNGTLTVTYEFDEPPSVEDEVKKIEVKKE